MEAKNALRDDLLETAQRGGCDIYSISLVGEQPTARVFELEMKAYLLLFFFILLLVVIPGEMVDCYTMGV